MDPKVIPLRCSHQDGKGGENPSFDSDQPTDTADTIMLT